MNKPLSNVAVKGSLIGENEKVVDDFSGITNDQGVLQYSSAIKHNAKLQNIVISILTAADGYRDRVTRGSFYVEKG